MKPKNDLIITRVHKGDYHYIYYLLYQEKIGVIGGDLNFLKYLTNTQFENEQTKINEYDYDISLEWIDCKPVFDVRRKK